MSSSITNPSDKKKPVSSVDNKQSNASPSRKGKSKSAVEDLEEEEEEEEEEGDDEDEDEDEDEEEDDNFEEIDPTAIVGRRTRGVRVDYTSKEALAKAGLEGEKDEESDDDVEMKD